MTVILNANKSNGFNLENTVQKLKGLSNFEDIFKAGFKFLGDLNTVIKLPTFSDNDQKELNLKAASSNLNEFNAVLRKIILGFNEYNKSQGHDEDKQAQVYEAETAEKEYDINSTAVFKGNPDKGWGKSEGLRFYQPNRELSVGLYESEEDGRKLLDGYQVRVLGQTNGLLVDRLEASKPKESRLYAKGKTYIGSLRNRGELDLNEAKFRDFHLGEGLLYDKKSLQAGIFSVGNKLSTGYIAKNNGIQCIEETQLTKLIGFNGLQVKGDFDAKGLPIDDNYYQVTNKDGIRLPLIWDAEAEVFYNPDLAVISVNNDKIKIPVKLIINLPPGKEIKNQNDFLKKLSGAKAEIPKAFHVRANPKRKEELVSFQLGNSEHVDKLKSILREKNRKLRERPEAPFSLSLTTKEKAVISTGAILLALSAIHYSLSNLDEGSIGQAGLKDKHYEAPEDAGAALLRGYFKEAYEEVLKRVEHATDKFNKDREDIKRNISSFEDLDKKFSHHLLQKDSYDITRNTQYLGVSDEKKSQREHFKPLAKLPKSKRTEILIAVNFLKKVLYDNAKGSKSTNNLVFNNLFLGFLDIHSDKIKSEEDREKLKLVLDAVNSLLIYHFPEGALSKHRVEKLGGLELNIPDKCLPVNVNDITVGQTLRRMKRNLKIANKIGDKTMVKDCLELAQKIYRMLEAREFRYGNTITKEIEELDKRYHDYDMFQSTFMAEIFRLRLSKVENPEKQANNLQSATVSIDGRSFPIPYEVLFGNADADDLLIAHRGDFQKTMDLFNYRAGGKGQATIGNFFSISFNDSESQSQLKAALANKTDQELREIEDLVNKMLFYSKMKTKVGALSRSKECIKLLGKQKSLKGAYQAAIIYNFLLVYKILRDMELMRYTAIDINDFESDHLSSKFLIPYGTKKEVETVRNVIDFDIKSVFEQLQKKN